MHSKSWHSLEGKTIWVTGGAGYLGSAITTQLDAHCGKVVCFDLADNAARLVKDAELQRTVARGLDVTDVTNGPAAVDAFTEEFGVPDGYVHLPTASSRNHTLESLPIEDFTRTFERGLAPTFVYCRAIAEKMKARGTGSVVLFASMYGMVAPDPRAYHEPMKTNPVDYGAAKAAVIQMTRYFAVHYGPANLRFNCVTPGPFPNPNVQKSDPAFIERLAEKTALRRIGRNTEIAGPTLFLLTDSASFVTGQSLVVDGGWTAW